jgi:hypothetical protein
MNHVCLKLIALGIYKLKNDVFDGFEVKPENRGLLWVLVAWASTMNVGASTHSS